MLLVKLAAFEYRLALFVAFGVLNTTLCWYCTQDFIRTQVYFNLTRAPLAKKC